MKKLLGALVVVALLSVVAAVAPRDSWAHGPAAVGIVIGIPAPVEAYPVPVYYPPAYVYGPPAVYGPQIVVPVGPSYRYYGPPWHYGRHYGHGRHRHHGDH